MSPAAAGLTHSPDVRSPAAAVPNNAGGRHQRAAAPASTTTEEGYPMRQTRCYCANPGTLACAVSHGYWPGGES